MKLKNIFFAFAAVLIMISCGTSAPSSKSAPIEHTIWDKLLKEHVNDQGMVDYKGFKKDQEQLKKYLDLISNNAPGSKWSEDEKLAYWINAYNAYTVQLILDYYPLKSIKDIGSSIKIPFVNTPWDKKFIKIGGKEMDLNNIEHGIVRKQFNEPRIHFALVCAAMSCPPLRNEAYTADKLDKQLDDQGRAFLNNPRVNEVSKDKASVSKILDWYGGDFKKKMPIKDWINKYAKTNLQTNNITFKDYNWALNEQK